MAKKFINPFDAIDRLTLTNISLNDDPIKIELKTTEYYRDNDGNIVPSKCTVVISGTPRDDSVTDKLAVKVARKVLSAYRTANFFIHGKDKWRKIHHDMIVLLLNLRNETEGWMMKIKTVESRSTRTVYENVCEYFGLIPDPPKRKEQDNYIQEVDINE